MAQISGVSRPGLDSAARLQARLWPLAGRVVPLRWRRAPLLAAALCFAIGDASRSLCAHPSCVAIPASAFTLALVALAFGALPRAPRTATIAASALWITIGLWSAEIEPLPAPQTELLSYADGLSRTMEARVLRVRELPRLPSRGADIDPDQWQESGSPVLSVDLALTAIEDVTPDRALMVPISGGVRALLLQTPTQTNRNPLPALNRSGVTLQLHCGDLVEAPVRLRIPERYRDPGAWQYADYLLDQGIAATGSVHADELRIDAVPPRTTADRSVLAALRCPVYAAQNWAAARLPRFVTSRANRALPEMFRLTPDDAGMLNAMLLGDRSRLSHAMRLGFERTGSFHLFVVSGMHVALLAALVFWGTRRLRCRETVTILLTLAVTTAYATLTGFGVPVERALLMTAVFLAARLLARERNVLMRWGCCTGGSGVVAARAF